jgi:uncharacterized integral membrane protein (TIGR00698 family)
MAVTETRAPALPGWTTRTAPGLAVAVLVAAVATVAGTFVPLVGGPVFGIVLGALAGATVPAFRRTHFAAGYAVAGRSVLQLSIVVLGAGLSLRQVVEVGLGSLPVMLGTLTVALGGAWLLGRLLGVRGDTQTLIGVGTGICGASAIAATSAVIKPKQAEVAYAVGTIFTFNIAAVLLFPLLGHLLGMSPHAFGLWAGTAINDTSSVVAASFSYGGDAGTYGVVVKLTRTLTLIPVVIFLAVRAARRSATDQEVRLPWRKIVPVFLLGFLATATLATIGVIPASWHTPLSTMSTFLITTALAGIGLSLRLSDMRAAGARPLLLGGLLWVAVAASSLGLQAITGTL